MYWLTRFATTALPQYDVQFSNGTAPADIATVGLVGGGVYDAYGTGVTRQRYPFQLRYQCSAVGPTESVARAQINTLKAMIGTRAKLWRTEAGADIPGAHWCWARLADVDDSMRAPIPMWIVPVTLAFTIMGPWKGLQHRDGWFFDSGKFFDNGLAFDSNEKFELSTSPQTVVVDNNGNIPVRDTVLWITAGDTAITYLKIALGSTEFEYTGTVAPGVRLTIDVENKSVLNGAAPGWADFNLTANHLVADWLVLYPGNNSVIVTTTFSAGFEPPTIEFRYSDGWA